MVSMHSLSDALRTLIKSVLPPSTKKKDGFGDNSWNLYVDVELSESGEVWLTDCQWNQRKKHKVGEVKIRQFLPAWTVSFITDPSHGEYRALEPLWGTVEEVAEFRQRLIKELMGG